MIEDNDELKKYKFDIVVDPSLDFNMEMKKRQRARNNTLDDKVKNKLKMRLKEKYYLSTKISDDLITITNQRVIINYHYRLPYEFLIDDILLIEITKANRMYVLTILTKQHGVDFICRDKRTLVRMWDFILKIQKENL